MKIVYLHQYFKTPQMAGGTRSYEMARRFAAAGHDVHIVTTRSDASKRGWTVERVDGVVVHWLASKYDNKMSFGRRLWAFATFAARSSLRARALKAEVVLASSTPLTIAIPGWAAVAGRRTPLVFEVRDLWPEVPIAMGYLKNPVLRRIARALESFAYRASTSIVALSEGMADGVRRTAPGKSIRVIPNSCDVELFQVPITEGKRFRDARPWLQDRDLIVYTGTLGAVNGVGYLVEVAYEYRKLDPEARFLIIGDGAEHDTIAALAAKLGVLDSNLFIEPPISKGEMPSVLCAADVCTSTVIPVPALFANSANKFFDALAAGRPIAINHLGWQADMIESYRLGVIMPSGDPKGGAQRLFSFLKDRTAVESARTTAAQVGEEQFSRDRLASELLEVLLEAPRMLLEERGDK